MKQIVAFCFRRPSLRWEIQETDDLFITVLHFSIKDVNHYILRRV